RVSLGIRQLLKHEIDLYTVVLDHPKVHLRVSSDGRTNLPQTPAKTNGPTNTKLLVRHVTIQDGLMDYNDEQIPLSAELEDFHAKADFEYLTCMYMKPVG